MKTISPPRDYRSLGIMLDRDRKPGGWEFDLTVSLWWCDLSHTFNGPTRALLYWLDEHWSAGFRVARRIVCRLGQHDPWCRGRRDHWPESKR